MSRLPANLRWQEVANILRKLGYRQTNERGSHLIFENDQGRMTTLLMKNPVKRGNLEDIIDQIGLSRKEFLELL